MNAVQQAALALVKGHGWYVFRLQVGHDKRKCDGGTANCKTVKIPDLWRDASSNDVKTVESWDWSRMNAYGIDCGKSGIVVVDQDPGDTWPYNGTRTHASGRGLHYLYEDTIGLKNAVGVKPWGVDVRGVGGMVIGPGSWHPHGSYAVAEDVPLAVPPKELLTAVARSVVPREPFRDDSPQRSPELGVHPYAAAGIKDELARLDECSVLGWSGPAWNSTTFAVACNLQEFANSPWSGYLPEDAQHDLMTHAPTDEGFGPSEHTGRWESALKKVGQGARPNPDGEAVDVFNPVPLPDSTNITAGNFIDPREGLRAQALARRVGQYLTCANGALDKRLYIYNDGVWRYGEEQIGTVVSLLLGDRYRASHLGTVKDKLRYDPATPVIDCGPTPRWINCRNGLLDWKTGEMSGHTPDALSVTQIPVEWHPDADCPAFERFIRQVLPEDCVDPTEGGPGLIWEMLGYFLYSGNPHHIAVLLRGKGRNGKGALLRMLGSLLGAENVSSVTLTDLTENRFRAANLYGKIANIAGDLDPKWINNTAMFKAITGGDSVTVEHKFGQAFDFTPWAVPVYSANRVFGSADSSEGYFSRWVVVSFPNDFTGREDRGLDAKLSTKAELEGVLRRAAQALPVLMERGRLPEPGSVKAAKHEFVVGGDRVRAWMHEHCAQSPDAWTNRTDLFTNFSINADFDVHKPMSRTEFYNRLDGINGIYDAKRKGERGFRGIRIKPVSLQEGA